MAGPQPPAVASTSRAADAARATGPGRTADATRAAEPGRTADAVRTAERPPTWSGTSIPRGRSALAWTLGVAGLLVYNWWILVPLKPGLMTSPDELFSNLEVSGQPYAAVMQHADVISGVLLLAALLAAGTRGVAAGRRDWLAMLGFPIAGIVGGLFPEVCADGINALCRQQEVRFQLPLGQYLHMAAGIVEFAAITIALIIAIRRTRGSHALTARVYRHMGQGALAAYPLLGLAYLVNRLGGLMEAVFFAGFTLMILTQLAERTRQQGRDRAAQARPRAAQRSRHPCSCGTS
jgi:hypothetical protein